MRRHLLTALVLAVPVHRLPAQSDLVNWETPHVHPLELTPDGALLLAVNTADGRLEVLDPAGATPIPRASIPVGLEPVSVRARTSAEAWVVNQVSDSVSVVDLPGARVVATLDTDDEPADVVFAGTPERAFVSCSQANTVLVFDPADLAAPPLRIAVDAEEPRAMAVSPDGGTVYVAIFESGNRSTVLGGIDLSGPGAYPPNAVGHPASPYGGQNPPPNSGAAFDPPQAPGNPPAPQAPLIVKQDDLGRWMDDNGGDWTAMVSGPAAALSGRPVGWSLPDRDLAVIDAGTLAVSYVPHLMNLCMALAVSPADGTLGVVGTDATNEIRFEPKLQGRFLRVDLALVDPTSGAATVVDLNPHLSYTQPTVPQSLRDRSLGDPRGVAWNGAGSRLYVTGLGSNNVVVCDATGNRAGLTPTIEVGQGPTGIVLDEARGRAYVLNRFEASISAVDLTSETEVARVPFFDPTPPEIRAGRPLLYDTHRTSGLGHVACASCHVDARMDRLAWDLGDPAGAPKPTSGQNVGMGIPQLGGGGDFHPMKGPMLTQTLQDIIGKEPFHWRGDRDGLEEFAGAFVSLQGDDAPPTAAEMQAFEDFLATIHFPPNPYREFDNTLPSDLPLPGHYSPGVFSPPGTPLPNGDANRGLALFRPPTKLVQGQIDCVTCHTLPVGIGTDNVLSGFVFVPIPPGPNGERHHGLVDLQIGDDSILKIPQLRNLYERVGFDTTQTANRAGFGFTHAGTVDSLARFVTEPLFQPGSDQDVADLVAFLLSFSGSDLPQGSATNPQEPPGTPGRDTHAAVGTQTTLVDAGQAPPGQLALIDAMLAQADAGAVAVVVKGVQAGIARGYAYLGSNLFQSDRAAEVVSAADLRAAARPGSELTYTVVPAGTETRIGIDRDRDGYLDRDELDAGSDPADPNSRPGTRLHVAGMRLIVLGSFGWPPTGGVGAAGLVRVADQDGRPVAGARVQVAWSGPASALQSAVTDARGRALFRSPRAAASLFCWTLDVLDLSAPGTTYDPGANVVSSRSAGNACP